MANVTLSPAFGGTIPSKDFVRTITSALNALPPAQRLRSLVVDFTNAHHSSRQDILLPVGLMSSIMWAPPDRVDRVEIRVPDRSNLAGWWQAEVVSLFSAAVRQREMLRVVVVDPGVDGECTQASLRCLLRCV